MNLLSVRRVTQMHSRGPSRYSVGGSDMTVGYDFGDFGHNSTHGPGMLQKQDLPHLLVLASEGFSLTSRASFARGVSPVRQNRGGVAQLVRAQDS